MGLFKRRAPESLRPRGTTCGSWMCFGPSRHDWEWDCRAPKSWWTRLVFPAGGQLGSMFGCAPFALGPCHSLIQCQFPTGRILLQSFCKCLHFVEFSIPYKTSYHIKQFSPKFFISDAVHWPWSGWHGAGQWFGLGFTRWPRDQLHAMGFGPWPWDPLWHQQWTNPTYFIIITTSLLLLVS